MSELLLYVAPIVVVEVVLVIVALVGIFRLYGCRNANKKVWALIVIFLQIFGPIMYFAFGKGNGLDS